MVGTTRPGYPGKRLAGWRRCLTQLETRLPPLLLECTGQQARQTRGRPDGEVVCPSGRGREDLPR